MPPQDAAFAAVTTNAITPGAKRLPFLSRLATAPKPVVAWPSLPRHNYTPAAEKGSPAGDGGALCACERSGQRCHFSASDKAETKERRSKEDCAGRLRYWKQKTADFT